MVWGRIYEILPSHIESKPLESTQDSKPAAHNQNKQVFVNFGGVDSNNLSQSFIDLLVRELTQQCHFHLVLGGGYPHKIAIPKPLENFVSMYHNLTPSEFLHLALTCDYALSAGGGSMLELAFSMDKDEFSVMVEQVRNTALALGKKNPQVPKSTLKKRRNFARSIWVTKDIAKGERFTKENIAILRPNGGMHPRYFSQILNTKAERDYKAATPLIKHKL